MKKILLVEKSPFVDENVHFLLKLAGFAPVMVQNMDEAINLVEIKRSVRSDFDLLIFSCSELEKYLAKYADLVEAQNSRIKVLVVGEMFGAHAGEQPCAVSAAGENVRFSFGDNLLFDVKKIFGDLDPPESMEWDELFSGNSG